MRKPVVVRASFAWEGSFDEHWDMCPTSDTFGRWQGNWIYRQPGGAVVRVTDAEFRANYEVVMDDVDEVDGTVTIYGVAYPQA